MNDIEERVQGAVTSLKEGENCIYISWPSFKLFLQSKILTSRFTPITDRTVLDTGLYGYLDRNIEIYVGKLGFHKSLRKELKLL
jgi:hypothetical protein